MYVVGCYKEMEMMFFMTYLLARYLCNYSEHVIKKASLFSFWQLEVRKVQLS